MQIHTVLNTAESRLAQIGGEYLAGSGFENELPDSGFSADVVTAAESHARED